MEKKILVNSFKGDRKCRKTPCSACPNCRPSQLDKRKDESNGNSLQLYAREAENYFFYYALRMKD